MMKSITFLILLIFISCATPPKKMREEVTFKSGDKELKGLVYWPEGKGPFPALIYNHGSHVDSTAADALGPIFASQGWIFFFPHRRGHGPSASAGPYILDELEAAGKTKGKNAAEKKLLELLKGDHLNDVLAGLAWLRSRKEVQKDAIAVQGNSFGGILTLLASEREAFCAGVAASSGSQSWSDSKDLRTALKDAVAKSQAPLFLFQAKNDYTVEGTRALTKAGLAANKTIENKIYPSFGKNAAEGHSFAYLGSHVWFPDVIGFLTLNCSK